MQSKQAVELPEGLRRRRVLRGAKGWVGRIAWSHRGDRIAVPSSDGTIRVWDPSDRGVGLVLGPDDSTLTAVFSASDRCIASAGMRGSVSIWGSKSGLLRRQLEACASVYSLGFSTDGATLAAGCFDGVIRLWATQGWSSRHNLEGDTAVTDLAWSPGERLLACAYEDGPVVLWEPDQRRRRTLWERPTGASRGLAWSPDGRYLAAGYGDRGAVAVWDVATRRLFRVLESASGAISALSFSFDSKLLAVLSSEGATHIWSSDRWDRLCTLAGETRRYWLPGVAFHPHEPQLAVPTRQDRVVEIFEIGSNLRSPTSESAVCHATAKVVLLGDAHAGKTSLGCRLATGKYKEHPSTHGQQIWTLDSLRSLRGDGVEHEVLLWDLAGQRDYRPLHTLFLGDADLILLVFDASRIDDPLDGVRYWLRALEHAGHQDRPMLLVGAKADGVGSGFPHEWIRAFCREEGIQGGYVATSALKGEGIDDLFGRLRAMLQQVEPTTTVSSAAFRRTKEAILALKLSSSVARPMLSAGALRLELERVNPGLRLSGEELRAALADLVKHGHVGELPAGDAERVVLLRPELLYNTAASIVVLAAAAHHRLGACEETRLFGPDSGLPQMPEVSAADRETLLRAALSMLLENAVCLREASGDRTLIVFPGFVHRPRPPSPGPPVDSLCAYVVEGAVEHLFATLAARVGQADFVCGVRHYRDEVEYQVGGDTCLIMRVDREDWRSLRLLLGKRGPDTAGVHVQLAGLIERVLLGLDRDLVLQRFQSVACLNCQDRPEMVEIERNIRNGRAQMGCAACGGIIDLDVTTRVDGRERDGGTTALDKEQADQRFRFQIDLTTLKSYVTTHGLTAPRLTLLGDVERRWARSFRRDLQDAGVTIDVRPSGDTESAGSTTAPPGCLLLELEDARAGAVLEAKGDLIVTPASLGMVKLGNGAVSRSPCPERPQRVWDFREPARYFLLLLDLLFVLYRVPPPDQRTLRPRGRAELPIDRNGKEEWQPLPSVVCIHSNADIASAERLQKHLAPLGKRRCALWTPSKIPAGTDRRQALERALSQAQIILMLISVDFLAEDQHEDVGAIIARRVQAPHLVPVLLSPVHLSETGLERLQYVPRSGCAISQWADKDQAWKEVVEELHQLLLSVDAS